MPTVNIDLINAAFQSVMVLMLIHNLRRVDSAVLTVATIIGATAILTVAMHLIVGAIRS